jgi:protoheme IX farnesyltransferase
MRQWLRIFLELIKFKISSLVTLSTATGFILASHSLSKEIIIPVAGIFLLACGSSGLNHYQDRKIDALMERTKLRPIPAGKIPPFGALFIALSLIFFGSLILFLGSNLVVLSLGIFAVSWYNGFYTYLKRKSTLAVIPGAIIGAIPPAIGWVAAGGKIFEPKILMISFFFFIWQLPHFWLLLLYYGKDYEKAGLPSLTGIFTTRQLKRLTFICILVTAGASLLIPLFGITNSNFTNLCLLAGTLWLSWTATNLLRLHTKEFSFRLVFREINIYALLVISLLSLDNLFITGYPPKKSITHRDPLKQYHISSTTEKAHPKLFL